MFKSLLLMGSVVSMIGAVPSVNIDNNSTSEKVEYNVSYPYETNEVNSNSDLHIGNIYKMNIVLNSGDSILDFFYTNGFVKGFFYGLNIGNSNLNLSYDDHYGTDEFNGNYIYINDCCIFLNYSYSMNFNFQNYDNLSYEWVDWINNTNSYCYIVLNQLNSPFDDYLYTFFQASDYLGEPIVTETEITGFYNVVYEWFDDYIFGVEALQSFEITLFGSTITLASYLSMISTIITLVILIITLFILIRWVFRSFSGLIR